MLTYIPTRLSFARLLLVALFVQSVTCEETTNQAAKETEPTITDAVLANNEKTLSKDQTQDSSIVPSNPALTASSQATDPRTVNTQQQFPENSDGTQNVKGTNQFLEPYLTEEQYGLLPDEEYASIYKQGINELKMPSQNELSEYVLMHFPDAQKRFMRGLKRYGDELELDEDKRFMRGFNFKRGVDFGDSTEGEFPNEHFTDKRFLKGFNKYAKKDEKRFMRGLRQDSSDEDLIDKRFMRGLRNWDLENVDDKRFIVGLNRFARVPEKRFMRGLSGYNKRFIHGLQNYGKRFMRGLVKRDDSAALENEKRFIVGLNGYGRRADGMDSDKGAENGETTKRFIKGFPSGKRFMKGFRHFSKKNSVGSGDEYFSRDDELSSDKRFMRGLTKKYSSDISGDEDSIGLLKGSNLQSTNSNDDYDKRFIKGLVKKSNVEELDKRFIKGLVKKSNVEELDKRFIKGLIKKSDDEEDLDKRFIKGLVKKSDGEDLDKRFIKGLVKKSDGEELDKRFIKGLVKKSDGEDLDKRFIKGLVKKSDGDEIDKRFIKGLVKKSDDAEDLDKRFIKGLVKKSDDAEDLDKRFIKGLVRKSDDDKRFMRGLNKKFDASEDKRFIKGLVNKHKSDKKSEDDKRFMRGFGKKNIEEDQLQGMTDKRFMRGFGKKNIEEDQLEAMSDKRFMRGFGKKNIEEDQLQEMTDKRFMRGFGKKNIDEEQLRGLTDKRFMRGFGKKNIDEEQLREMTDKRFMRGLYAKKDNEPEKFMLDNEFTNEDINDNDKHFFVPGFYNVDGENTLLLAGQSQNKADLPEKRFIKGFQKYVKKENARNFVGGSDMVNDKRFMRGLIKKDDAGNYGRDDKRFMRGLVKKEDSDNIHEEMEKRFMRGLVKRESGQSREKRETRSRDESDPDVFWKQDVNEDEDPMLEKDSSGTWYDFPVYQQFLPEKRFMRGLGQYAKRDFDDRDKEFDDNETGYDEDYDISKRFLKGFLDNYGNRREFLPKRLTSRDEFESAPSSEKRFIKGLDMYPKVAMGKRFMRGMQYIGRRASDDTFLQDKRFMRGLSQFSRGIDKRFIRGLGKYVKRPLDSNSWGKTYSDDTFNKRFFTGHQIIVPDNHHQQLLGPSYRHSQLSFSNDQKSPIHFKVDSITDPFSGGSSQMDPRRFLDWRKGGYNEG